MIKVITLLTRKEGMSHEEFSQYWEKEFGPLVPKTFPSVKRYIQNHLEESLLGAGPQLGGIAEVWYDDIEGLRETGAIYQSDEGKVIRDAEDNFTDRSKLLSLVVEEKVIK